MMPVKLTMSSIVMTALLKRKNFLHLLVKGIQLSLGGAVISLCSPFILVVSIQHLVIAFYCIPVHSVDPTLRGVAVAFLKILNFHYIVKNCRHFTAF